MFVILSKIYEIESSFQMRQSLMFESSNLMIENEFAVCVVLSNETEFAVGASHLIKLRLSLLFESKLSLLFESSIK